MSTSLAFNQRRTCSVKEACAAVPCGRTHLYKMIRAGTVQVKKFGGKTLILTDSLPGFSLHGKNEPKRNVEAMNRNASF